MMIDGTGCLREGRPGVAWQGMLVALVGFGAASLPAALIFVGGATLSASEVVAQPASKASAGKASCGRAGRRYRHGEVYVPDPRARIGIKGQLVCRNGRWVLVSSRKIQPGRR